MSKNDLFCAALAVACLAAAPVNAELELSDPVEGVKDVVSQKGSISFVQGDPHCFFNLKDKTSRIVDSVLEFNVDASADGFLTIYKTLADGKLTMLDTKVTIIRGANDYQVDLAKYPFGSVYPGRSAESKPDLEKWESGDVTGLRIDTWFPVGAKLQFKSAFGRTKAELSRKRKLALLKWNG